ncbi:MAG: RNA polymerase subunit sigma-24 [Acidobacteriota bacterium]
MGTCNRYEDIEPYAVRILRRKAHQLTGRAGFTASDHEDIEQDIVLDLLVRLPKYDPSRSQYRTFVNRLIKHKVATILEARRAEKRNCDTCVLSVDKEMGHENADGRVLNGRTLLDEYSFRASQASRSFAEQVNLYRDVPRIVSTLPVGERELCHRLRTKCLKQVSEETGVPRATIYEAVDRIRRRFQEAGLKEYL